jgi:hypothetical protein
VKFALILMEEHRLGRIFGPKRAGVMKMERTT